MRYWHHRVACLRHTCTTRKPAALSWHYTQLFKINHPGKDQRSVKQTNAFVFFFFLQSKFLCCKKRTRCILFLNAGYCSIQIVKANASPNFIPFRRSGIGSWTGWDLRGRFCWFIPLTFWQRSVAAAVAATAWNKHQSVATRLLGGEHNTRYVGWCEVTVALLFTLIIAFFFTRSLHFVVTRGDLIAWLTSDWAPHY